VIVVYDGDVAPSLEDVELPSGVPLKRIVQDHAGPAAARNRGAANARRQFVAFTDDDCEPDRDWLRVLSIQLMSKPNGAVGGRTINALPDNPYSTASQELVAYLYTHLNREVERARFVATNNLAVSLQRFRDVGGFDERFTFAAGEDRDFCDRCAPRVSLWRTRPMPSYDMRTRSPCELSWTSSSTTAEPRSRIIPCEPDAQADTL
jgi:glycosyltransferase involved in cell wall biosynthesis